MTGAFCENVSASTGISGIGAELSSMEVSFSKNEASDVSVCS